MKFQLPETLVGLSLDELAKLRADARVEIDAINSVDGDLSTEQLDALESLLSATDTIDAQASEIQAADQARAERAEALRSRVSALDEVEEEGGEAIEGEPEAVEPESVEPVLASGQRRPTVRKAATAAPEIRVPKEEAPVENRRSSIVAAANVPDFNSGQSLEGMSEVAKAFLARTGTFASNTPLPAGTYQMTPAASRHGVARIRREDSDFSLTRGMSVEEQFSTIMAAADEKRLSGGSVLAAGGWCAPSETIYDIFGLETSAGLLDIAEVVAARGGINFTKGPDFMTVFTDPNAGFIQTEAQAEAGDTKPCYALECPPFEEVRLDAVGFCVTAPLLTNAAYPELTRRTLDLVGLGHARRKSAETIKRIAAAAGAAVEFTPVDTVAYSGVSDVLGAIELQAMLIRQKYAMDPEATIEGFAPYWFRAAARHELSRRLGLTDPFRITNADVDSYLAVRNIKLQYPYDYQMLTDANTSAGKAYPTEVEVTLYPAGAFVRLVNNVINLDAVYDHDLLTKNTYTAAFMEEGMGVANTRGNAVKVKAKLDYRGRSGYPAIGARAA